MCILMVYNIFLIHVVEIYLIYLQNEFLMPYINVNFCLGFTPLFFISLYIFLHMVLNILQRVSSQGIYEFREVCAGLDYWAYSSHAWWSVASFGQTSKEEPLQTPLEKALQWAEKGEPDIAVQGFVPPREERISFAALQPIAGTYFHLLIYFFLLLLPKHQRSTSWLVGIYSSPHCKGCRFSTEPC